MLPTFIIAGAPKAGTTSLYHYLSEHPEVFMSEPKEVNFFSREEIEAQGLYYPDFKARTLQEYEALFDRAGSAKAIGEGSVSYLFYPSVPIKIKETIPNVKIIILLRDPVERAYSHYLMDYRLGLVDVPFETIVTGNSDHPKQELYYQQYVLLGMYYEQVRRYLDVFGSDQVRIYLQDDLKSRPVSVISDLYAFLGVDPSCLPDMGKQHNAFSMPKNRWVRALYSSARTRSFVKGLAPRSLRSRIRSTFFQTEQKPKMAESCRKYLKELYRDDVDKLEELIGRELSSWR